MRVAVVSEYYPREADPVLGIWAHEQAVAARDAGADVRVVVLHRVVPPAATARRDLPAATLRLLRQPRHALLDGIPVSYVRFVSPPRPSSYGSWGRWAAPSLALALRRLRRGFPFDLVHAHNAVPAADAVLRARIDAPLVVSEHGIDVYYTALRHPDGRAAIARAFGAARLVLANSTGIAHACEALGARATRVVRLGADLPMRPAHRDDDPTLVTLAHLVPRKRHADVLRAMWALRERHPRLRYVVVGDGPERDRLAELARELGIADRVELAGQLPHAEALERARRGWLFVMPSIDEAFGVAYVEAMAGGLPAIGALGEPGPAEIARIGDGLRLVPPGDVERLARAIDELLDDQAMLAELGIRARETVERAFTWRTCGRATLAAYEEALAP
ncbi:MAG: glycosyltransferase family 4 protein [Solirubrobacteraceae bacterium]|nr:glycosyltransferase family 4 protein [Solirubrobacteraceae bacterium]